MIFTSFFDYLDISLDNLLELKDHGLDDCIMVRCGHSDSYDNNCRWCRCSVLRC